MATERDVGFACSGGGHRATVFALGALLAAVDTEVNQQVTSISSVSGGSIANGIVMTGPDFGAVETPEFEKQIKPALGAIASRGLLLGKAPATANYIRTLIVVGVAAGLGLIGIVVFTIARVWAGILASLGVVVGSLLALWWLFRQRSVRTERAIDDELLGKTKRSLARVKADKSQVHHVICTTELQTGESFYFTNRAVYAYRFGGNTGDVDVPLATAVQASACVPGAFAPRVLPLSKLGVHSPTNRAGEQNTKVQSIVVNDGGVYDNMADQWEYGFVGRTKSWSALTTIQPERGSFIVVVNGSGGWNNPKPIGRGGVAREIAGLARSQSVQYDVSTSHRRQALYDRFTDDDPDNKDETRGVFVQITDSPYRIPTMFRSDPVRGGRAAKAIEFLDAQGYDRKWWDDVVSVTSGVKTTLAKLGVDTTAKLLEHGYVLAMVNTYVLDGRGSLVDIDRDRFRELCT